jgi:hypothetical protein
VRGIALNYTVAQLVNCDSIMEMILGTDARDITVRTERKIKCKIRKSDGSGLAGADTVTINTSQKRKCTESRLINAGV